MKRRILLVTAAALSLSAAASGAQALVSSPTSTNYWGCAGVKALDQAICLKNPLPERLPVPSTPSVPAPAPS